MILLLKSLRCLVGLHGNTLFSSTDDGTTVLVCADCGDSLPILATAVVKGPKAEPDKVRGKPKTRTYQEATRSKIRRVG